MCCYRNLDVVLYILLLIAKYVYKRWKVKNIKKLCSSVVLGKWYLPYVDIIFLTNFKALISSAEWLDFYTDSEEIQTLSTGDKSLNVRQEYNINIGKTSLTKRNITA